MNLPYDDVDMEPLPASFLARLQPAGAFLLSEPLANSLRSPTALTQRQGSLVAPAMTPLAHDVRAAQLAIKPTMKPNASGAVAMSFMSAMRRGLDGLQGESDEDEDDEEDEDKEDDEDSGYYQPAYSQYHAPTASYTGRASAPPSSAALPAADDDELIFPMEL